MDDKKPIEWELPLRRRPGSLRRLSGLDVFHDFGWRKQFGHDRSTFPHGQSLAELIARECPAGKKGTLLLTGIAGVEPGIITTEDRHIAIIPIKDYLSYSETNVALSYYYSRLAAPSITQQIALADVKFSAEELTQFLTGRLDQSALNAWAAATPANLELIRSVAGTVTSANSLAEGLSGLSETELESFTAILSLPDSSDVIKRLVEAVTKTTAGRDLTAMILGARLGDRISDARSQLKAYRELISRSDVTETHVQQFLEKQPWIVGLAYVHVKPRRGIPRGILDFVLERYDGFVDFMELKGPAELIVTESAGNGALPASPSKYSLGPALANALAQAHFYRSTLEKSVDLTESLYGFGDSRQPRILILVGRYGDLSESGKEILRQLNLSLHRVEIVPYDLLAERTEGWLKNVESLVAGSE